MLHQQRGFTLLELIAVMILIGILSVALISRVGGVSSASVQAGRDSLVAALFFAQQLAMARNTEIRLTTSGNQVNVTDAGVSQPGYPLILNGITLTPHSFSYDRLGRTDQDPVSIQLSGAGASATVTVERSGYAHY